jgi:hypothetical protein
MSTLILTTYDGAAGCLGASRIADHVIAIDYRLVTGPVPPVSDPLAFFAERAKLGCPEIRRWDQDGPGSQLCQAWLGLIQASSDFDRIEIWADSEPNSQLQLLQFLEWLSAYPDIVQKLSLTSPDFRIGSRTPQDIVALKLPSQSVSDMQFQTAKVALHAFQQPNPEAWFNLLRDDLQALPYLRPTVTRVLEELPAADTALTHSETRLLEIISAGPIPPMRALGEYLGNTPLSVLDSWELGRRMHWLAHCQKPAILGLDDGPFNLELHDDPVRFDQYKRSKLTLSELGHALLERQEDFSRHNRIDHWWGGTRLTNDRLWRWHAINHSLLSPAG